MTDLATAKYLLDRRKTAYNTIFMIKGVSFVIQGFALYSAPSRGDSWEVLNPLSS